MLVAQRKCLFRTAVVKIFSECDRRTDGAWQWRCKVYATKYPAQRVTNRQGILAVPGATRAVVHCKVTSTEKIEVLSSYEISAMMRLARDTLLARRTNLDDTPLRPCYY